MSGKFNFEALSPPDFEGLVRDLLQADWNVSLESFKEGRDSGIDLRYAPVNGGKTIVQCKRYSKSGYAKLLANLRDDEKPKIELLNPDRYVVATVIGLTPANKDKIISAMCPYVLTSSDVIGADDLDGLLSRYPHIERANFKLWLTSTAVLERVLHNAEVCQTDFEVARARRKLPLFVQSEAFSRARQLLDETRIVVISGPPGIGKTTLAEMLLYAHLEQGYEPVVIKGAIVEGKRLFNAGRKQIFYYDDFLGQTFLGDHAEHLEKNEDSAIVDFMELVSTSDHARFVLTAREHILSGALQSSERLGRSSILHHRCILTLGDYTLGHKARILYNHLYFSDLSEAYKEAVLVGDFFMDIINHAHFNPRLIEWLSKSAHVRSVAPEAYQAHIKDMLDNPEAIWSYAYRNQISDSGRHILLSLYTIGERNNAIDLEPAFLALHRANAEKYNHRTAPGDFRRALQELDGGFLTFSSGAVSFLNPSIREFVASVICAEREVVQDLLAASIRFKQGANLWSLLVARSGATAKSILATEESEFLATFGRLLNGPTLRWEKDGTGRLLRGHYIDMEVEARLVFLMELAERQKSPQTMELALRAVAALVGSWERASLSFYFVLRALKQFSENSWFLEHGGRVAHRQIIDGVLSNLTFARATDWIELVKLPTSAIDWSATDQIKLDTALADYENRVVLDEERDCADLDELIHFKSSLEILTASRPAVFANIIYRVDESIAVRESEREGLREDKGYSSSMKAAVEASLSDEELQDMFATLIEE